MERRESKRGLSAVTVFGGHQGDPSGEEKKLLSRQTNLYRPRWSRFLPVPYSYSWAISEVTYPGIVCRIVSRTGGSVWMHVKHSPSKPDTNTTTPKVRGQKAGRDSEQLPVMGCGVWRWRGSHRNPQGNRAPAVPPHE